MQKQTLPHNIHYENIIVCGGGMHVDQEQKYPWLKDEKKFLETSMKNGAHIVGLCLGGQLCAQILGAEVYPHPQGWETGWHNVHLQKTLGLPGFEEDRTLMFSQYHRYIFEAPKDSKIIAHNDWWQTQAFVWNNQVVGFQFHPERDLEVNRLMAEDRELPTEGHTHSKEQITQLGNLHQPISQLWFENMLNGFLQNTNTSE